MVVNSGQMKRNTIVRLTRKRLIFEQYPGQIRYKRQQNKVEVRGLGGNNSYLAGFVLDTAHMPVVYGLSELQCFFSSVQNLPPFFS